MKHFHPGLDWNKQLNPGLFCNEDIVVVGYVDKIAELLVKEHGFQALPFENEDRGFSHFGPRGMFGATVLISESSKRRVVLLGFTHSFWGRTAAKIADTCLRAGASHFIYVAKAGTRTGRIRPDSDGDRNKHFLCLIGGQYLVWEGDADDPEGRVREVKLRSSQNQLMGLFTNKKDRANASKSHLSVPSVVGEDYRQFQAYGNYNPSSIDNEISFIAEEVGRFENDFPDREVTFSCVHFITDLVVSNLNISSSTEAGLDQDHQLLPEKVDFWATSTDKLASFIETHGVIGDTQPLSFIREQGERRIHFDRFGQLGTHLNDDEIAEKYRTSQDILACYPKSKDEPKLEEAILRGMRGSSFQILGEAGSGKSVLAENLFFYLRDAHERNDFQFRPYYIDITSHEKAIIQGSQNPDDIWTEIVGRVSEATEKFGPLSIIYDGIDDQSPFRDCIEAFLRKGTRTQLEKDCISIFFQRVYRNVGTDHRGKVHVLGVDVGIDGCFELGSLAHDDGRVVGVKENLTRLLALTAGIEDDAAEELTSRISSWPEFSVNLRLLNLVQEYEQKNEAQFDGPSSFFRQFSVEYLKSYSPGMAIDSLKDLAAEVSFNFLVESEPFPVETHQEVLVKRLATQSMEMLCYLAARHLDIRMFDREGYSEDRVFPHLINKYSKELLRSRDQKEALSRLLEMLADENSGVRLRSFATYLIGRVNSGDLRKQAVEALLSAKRSLEGLGAHGDERDVLIFDRSINISLIYLGEDSRDYILKLMNSRVHDEINRGFHLAYYGDIDYFASPDMLNPDDGICGFDRSAANLATNLHKDGLGANLVNLSAYTLFSLAHTRLLHGAAIKTAERTVLVDLARNDLLQRESMHSEVKDFIGNCVRYLESSLGPDAFAFSQVARLKSHLRTGWNDPKLGRSVPDCETVFSHVGSAVYLAVAYLPEDVAVAKMVSENILPVKYSGYNKDRIIRMLAVHDIGEHDAGDIASPNKTGEDLRIERNSTRFITMISAGGSGELLGGFSDAVWELWSEFEERSSINAMVARDIDVLECLAQLCDYSQDEKNQIRDTESFKQTLLDGVTTEIGKHLSTLFIRSFSPAGN